MSTGVVEQFEAAITDLDAATFTDAELDRMVTDLVRVRHRLAGVTAALLARWDTSGVWKRDGSRSAAARLARDAAMSQTSAAIELRRARKLDAMPATAAAVVAGRLSMDHVDLLGRADQPHRHNLFARDEEMLVDQCATLRHTQAVRAVDYWIQRADGELGDSSRQPEPPRSRVHVSATYDAKVRIDGWLNGLDGPVFSRELTRLERQQYLADEAAGVTRTHSERLAAALVEMATRSASTPAGSQRPKPLFTVLLGDNSFERLCELGNGAVIAPDLLVPHLGTAEMETMLFDGPFTAIAASTTRSFTGKLRRAIEVRDRHCQHPSGCDVPAENCDVDHIIPVTQLGPTSQFNGRIQCWPHNRDATKHDRNAVPHPERSVGYLDQLRARLRWQVLHQHNEDGDDDDSDEPAA